MSARSKLSIEYINKSFNSGGYVLLSDLYKGSKNKLDYMCSIGHIHRITWGNWQQGHRCPYCKGNAKHTLGHIKSEFLKEGRKNPMLSILVVYA